MKKEKPLNIFTIFFSPVDYPGAWVVRRFECDKPTDDFAKLDDLNACRHWVFRNLSQYSQGAPVHVPREPGDHVSVIESWV